MTCGLSPSQPICMSGDAALTNQQNKKKNTCNRGGQRCPPEVIVADEDHVDRHICHGCDEGHDGRTPHIVLNLHCLQRSHTILCQYVMHGKCRAFAPTRAGAERPRATKGRSQAKLPQLDDNFRTFAASSYFWGHSAAAW